MSYDYYLQAHLHEDLQEIPTDSILTIFEKYIFQREEDFIDLEFEEGNSCTIYIKTTNQFSSAFSVNRPCGSEQLGECLYQVMLLGNFVFFEPDGKHPIILNATVEGHLPTDMIDSLGKPAIAENKEAFLQLYYHNR